MMMADDPGGEKIEMTDFSNVDTVRDVSEVPKLRHPDSPIPSVEVVSPEHQIVPRIPLPSGRRPRAITSAAMLGGFQLPSVSDRSSGSTNGGNHGSQNTSEATPSTLVQGDENSLPLSTTPSVAPNVSGSAGPTGNGQEAGSNTGPYTSTTPSDGRSSSAQGTSAPSGGNMRATTSSEYTRSEQGHQGQQHLHPNQAGVRNRPLIANQPRLIDHPNPLAQHPVTQTQAPHPIANNPVMSNISHEHGSNHSRNRHTHVYGTGFGRGNEGPYPFSPDDVGRNRMSSISPYRPRYDSPPPFGGSFRGYGGHGGGTPVRTPDVFGPFIDDIHGPPQPVMSLGPFYPRGPEDVPDIMRTGSHSYTANNGGRPSSVHHRDGTPIADNSPTVGRYDPFFPQPGGNQIRVVNGRQVNLRSPSPIANHNNQHASGDGGGFGLEVVNGGSNRQSYGTLSPQQYRNGFMGRAAIGQGQYHPGHHGHQNNNGSRGPWSFNHGQPQFGHAREGQFQRGNYQDLPAQVRPSPLAHMSPNSRVSSELFIDPRILTLSPGQPSSAMRGTRLLSEERARAQAVNPNSTTRVTPVSPVNRGNRGTSRLAQELVLASVEEDKEERAGSDDSDKTEKAANDDDRENTPRSAGKRRDRDHDDNNNGGPGPSGSGAGASGSASGGNAGASGSGSGHDSNTGNGGGNTSSGNNDASGGNEGGSNNNHASSADDAGENLQDSSDDAGSGKGPGGSGGGVASDGSAADIQSAASDPESPTTRPFCNMPDEDPFIDDPHPELDDAARAARTESYLDRMRHPHWDENLFHCWLPLAHDSDYDPLECEVYGAMSPTVKAKVLQHERRIHMGIAPDPNFDIATIFDEAITKVAGQKQTQRHNQAMVKYFTYLRHLGECDRTSNPEMPEKVFRRGMNARRYLQHEGYSLEIYRSDMNGEMHAEMTLRCAAEVSMIRQFQSRFNGLRPGVMDIYLTRPLDMSINPKSNVSAYW